MGYDLLILISSILINFGIEQIESLSKSSNNVVNKLLHVKHGLELPTDRDSFMYKRVDLSGFLLASLFRENYRQLQRDVKIAIDTERFREQFKNSINTLII